MKDMVIQVYPKKLQIYELFITHMVTLDPVHLKASLAQLIISYKYKVIIQSLCSINGIGLVTTIIITFMKMMLSKKLCEQFEQKNFRILLKN